MIKVCKVYFSHSDSVSLALNVNRKNELLPILLDSNNPLHTNGLKEVIEALNLGYIPVILGNQIAADSWEKLLLSKPFSAVDFTNLIAIIATSGTTGEPKWVPIAKQQIVSSIEGSPSHLLPDKAKAWLLSLPIHHTGGLAVLLRSAIRGNDVVVASSMKVKDVCKSLQNYASIQTLSLVPKQLNELISSGNDSLDLLRNKRVLLGGGPVSVELRKQIQQLELSVFYSYGMSETFGHIFAINALDLDLTEVAQNIAGKISKNNAFAINEKQHLLVKGSQVFGGYLGSSKVANSSQESWFSTGDIAQVNEYGNLEILMRRTDLIVSGGKNIRPQEVEQLITEKLHLPIESFVVVGVKDEEWGEIVGLCIEEDPLLQFNKKMLANYEQKQTNLSALETAILHDELTNNIPKNVVPRVIKVIKQLPRTDIGKIKRAEIKALMNA